MYQLKYGCVCGIARTMGNATDGRKREVENLLSKLNACDLRESIGPAEEFQNLWVKEKKKHKKRGTGFQLRILFIFNLYADMYIHK